MSFTAEQVKYWHKDEHRQRRDPRHPIIEAYVGRKLDCIQRYVPDIASVLDVGAGNGYFSEHWQRRATTTAIDYSAVILENNPVADKRVMDARKLEFPDGTFDLSFCHALLHHIDTSDRATVIREMARVSREYIAIIEPNSLNPMMMCFGVLKKEEHALLRFTKKYLRDLVAGCGLEIVYARSWGLLTPNRMPIPRFLLPLMNIFERPIPFGITNIVIAKKKRS